MKVLFLILSAFISITSFANSSQIEITFAADDWCPITCTEDNKTGPGVLAEVIQESLKGSSYQFKYSVLNWARAVEMAKQNKIDGLLGVYKTDYPDFHLTEKEMVISKDCLFSSLTDPISVLNDKTLKNLQIGVINGYEYGEPVDPLRKNPQTSSHFHDASGDDPLDQNVKKVLSKRLSHLLENKAVIDYNKTIDPQFKDLKVNLCFESKGIYAATNPKSVHGKKVLALVSKFMKSKEGQKFSKEIQKKYGLGR